MSQQLKDRLNTDFVGSKDLLCVLPKHTSAFLLHQQRSANLSNSTNKKQDLCSSQPDVYTGIGGIWNIQIATLHTVSNCDADLEEVQSCKLISISWISRPVTLI